MTRGGGRFDFEEHLLSDVHDLPPLARLVGMTLATFADGASCDLGMHSPSFEVLRKRAGISKKFRRPAARPARGCRVGNPTPSDSR